MSEVRNISEEEQLVMDKLKLVGCILASRKISKEKKLIKIREIVSDRVTSLDELIKVVDE